jgi:hypothetical protein
MFALNIPSSFGDTIDCRINGKPKRVTWRDEHTLVIVADPYATGPVDMVRFGANWRRLHGERNFDADERRCRIQKSLKSHPHVKNSPPLLPREFSACCPRSSEAWGLEPQRDPC